MPKPVIDEDRLRRKKLLEEKRSARRAAKAVENRDIDRSIAQHNITSTNLSQADVPSYLLELPQDALFLIFSLLPAADLGRLTLTCKTLNLLLPESRISYLLARLHSTCKRRLELCLTQAEARQLLDLSYGGGETGKILPKGKFARQGTNDFVAYARFLEEAVSGHSTLSTGNPKAPIVLPVHVQGRFASVSPEHSVCRVGGDGFYCGAGGSGVASWGVGKRGQLGHGKRQDERKPRMLMGGLGYGVRIVQVSAGGGLVRVAHTLLLTSTGRVLSFGTGQYGALGHGYSAAKQLPDQLRPTYVEALRELRCICVSAGELHSAVVTCDGDVYTWGDGFCGQLGHGDKRPQLTPKQVTCGGLEDECVATVSCGSRHTLAVTEDGEVFSWGLGHFGVLGRSFTPFDYDADAAVVAFTGGDDDPLAVALAAPDRPQPAAPDAIQPLNGGVDDDNGRRDLGAELIAHLDLIANLTLDDSSDQCIPKLIESLEGIHIVGACAGHRHTLLLDDRGFLYSCGSGVSGCLGHGDYSSQMYPMKITGFDEENIHIRQMSAGVDMSMAVSTTGEVYAWGKVDGGRLGLELQRGNVSQPRRVVVRTREGADVKAVDVECGYVHSLIVGLDGTLFICGGVGVEGEDDGQQINEPFEENDGRPRQVNNFNIWHRVPEPKEEIQQVKWKKYGKYEVKGRRKMMGEVDERA